MALLGSVRAHRNDFEANVGGGMNCEALWRALADEAHPTFSIKGLANLILYAAGTARFQPQIYCQAETHAMNICSSS